jgi:anti-anti-sigma regulatory factor
MALGPTALAVTHRRQPAVRLDADCGGRDRLFSARRLVLSGDDQHRIGVDVREEREPGGAEGIMLLLDPTMGRPDIGPLCVRLAELLREHRAGGAVVVCDVSGVVEASAVVVEALARLRLTARRLGAEMRVRGAQPDLRGLLALTGLDGVVLRDGDGRDSLRGDTDLTSPPPAS